MTKRSYLFIHQNMPGQFLHLCLYLRDRGHNIAFITKNKKNQIGNITKVTYEPSRGPKADQHPYLSSTEDALLHGQAVFRAIKNLEKTGFKPDVVVGHCGWGETLFVKDALPNVPLLNYFEYFYRPFGQDFNFDPEYPGNIDGQLRIRTMNATALMAGASGDWGMTPTQWQYSTHPVGMQARMSVMHEGVDTQAIRPNPDAAFTTESGKVLRAGHKVVTFVARNLEPYRGFPTFMRAIPEIQRRHPDAEILVVGMDGVSYGIKLPEGDSYKKRMLAEVQLDASRVHFTGYLESPQFRAAMHVSMAHIYLTYPFILSWSLVEAMASECLIIGSRTAPVEEVITHKRTGLLVDFKDHAALADRVCEVLARPEAYRDIRHAARQLAVSEFDLRSVCLPRQLGLVDSLLGPR